MPHTQEDKISITTVGPTWGSSITDKAIQALIIFFIVVAVYISFRFEPKMALAAFIAMIHDVLVAIGIYSIFNFQVTPDTVVAILTILGYSLYDTVVVFDRVRDNTRGIGSSGRMTYPQLINLSMNQTLARSINTSMVAILPVLAVLLIGAQVLGATTRSSPTAWPSSSASSRVRTRSIFIASPVLSMMKEREDRWVSIARRLAGAGRHPRVVLQAVEAASHEHPDERRRPPVRSLVPGAAVRLRPHGRRHQAQRAHPAGCGRWGRGGSGNGGCTAAEGGTGSGTSAVGPGAGRKARAAGKAAGARAAPVPGRP